MCLVAGALPAGASAAEAGVRASGSKAMNYRTGGISAGGTVYYGYGAKTTHGWLVLDAQKTNAGKNGLFLLYQDGFGPEKIIDSSKLKMNGPNDTRATRKVDGKAANTWYGSDAQIWCTTYATSNFTAGELAAIPSVSKNDPTGSIDNNVPYGSSNLSKEQVFLLSAKEYTDYRKVIPQTNWTWWLRSPLTFQTVRAIAIGPNHIHVDTTQWIRPAFNINRDSVLFTSAAEGGKSDTTDANLTSISGYTRSDWKLTLLDGNRSGFTSSASAYDAGTRTVTVKYSGASTGANEYVSTVIMDGNNNITHYGRLKNTTGSGDANGTVQVTLPSDFDSRTDTLCLFSEQYNGDKKTDYASDLQKVSFSVDNQLTNITSSNRTTSVPVAGTSDYTATLKATGDYVLPDSITVKVGDTTLTAGEGTYIYNSSTGELKIKAAAITGNIVITAEAKTVATIEAPEVAANVRGGGAYASGSWASGDVTLTVSGASAPSGIGKYQYSTDDGANWTDMANGATSLTVSNDSTSTGGTAFSFRAVSKSGTTGAASEPFTVKIDKTATIRVSGNTSDYLQRNTVAVTADAGFSGIAKVEVSKDSGVAQDITNDYKNGYAVTENGTYTFTVTNGAGVTATDSITYDKLDRTKPVVSLDTHGYTSDTWTNGDVTLSVSDVSGALGDATFEYKVDNGDWQTFAGTVTVSDETDGTDYSFRATSASGVESEIVSVTVKIDKTAPDGDITIEQNSVKKFIHDVTFGLFFKENVEVGITGKDSDSGVQKIEYHRSAEVLSEEQVAALTDWTRYTSAITETAQDAERFIYYVRVTDNVGNVTCFASNGATFDLTKPVIIGITDGAEYCTTQSVQVTDASPVSVTLNAREVDASFDLAGNTETEYVIVATDEAGNETSVTVTMHKTETLRENLGDITKDNATSSDRETVRDYLDDLRERLKDEKLSDEEKTVLEGLANEAQGILDRLDGAERAASTEAIGRTRGITSENVTPKEKEALGQAKGDMEQALDAFGGNYTDGEKAELKDGLSRIEKALAVIKRIEDAEAAIEALPDTVDPSDTEAEKQIDAAKGRYDALSDRERSLVSAEAKDKLEGLLAALRDYRITEGSGSTWTKGSSAGLTFRANGAYGKFTGIEVDGKAVEADGYAAENGSTVITLEADYLETLAAGRHTLTVLYADGEATGTFTIAEKIAEKPAEVVDDDAELPQTGDNSNIALLTPLLAAGAGIILIATLRRKRPVH